MRRFFLFILLALTSVSGGAWAYEVQPMRHHLAVDEGVTSSLITVTNDKTEALPIEIVVSERVYDEAGKESIVPNEADFIVFPPQALIPPGRSQAVRFQFIGDPDMAVSRSFVLDVKEVPVETENFTGFKFAYNFGVAVYVRAPGAKSDVSIASSSLTDDVLTVEFMNDGRDFARLSNDRLVIETAAGRTVLNGAEFSALLENPVLPPKSPRTVALNVEGLALGSGDVNVTLRENRGR